MKKLSRVTAHTVWLMVIGQIFRVGILLAQQPPGAPPIRDPKAETRDRQDREATLMIWGTAAESPYRDLSRFREELERLSPGLYFVVRVLVQQNQFLGEQAGGRTRSGAHRWSP